MKKYLLILALFSGVVHADFNLMSDDEICRQYGERCQQTQQYIPAQQNNYPSFYGSGPVQQYIPPQPPGSFSRWYTRNVQLIQAYDDSCQCIRVIGIPQ